MVDQWLLSWMRQRGCAISSISLSTISTVCLGFIREIPPMICLVLSLSWTGLVERLPNQDEEVLLSGGLYSVRMGRLRPTLETLEASLTEGRWVLNH